MKVPKRNKRFLRELNNTKIPVDLFRDAIYVLIDLGKDINVFERRVVALSKLFFERCDSPREAGLLCQSFEFRMKALMKLKVELNITEDDEGLYPNIAADEPLIEHDLNGIIFDAKRFQDRLDSINRLDAETR